jgi:hypothetical protein
VKKYTTIGVKLTAEVKVTQYLARWPEGLTSARMGAWINSCTKHEGYTPKEFESALRFLRDSGRIAIANGIWYPRGVIRKDK